MEDKNIITLNVGGTIFKTKKSTLTTLNFFEALVNRWSEISNEEIFIDQDPKIFIHILNLLRNSDYIVPEKYNDNVINMADYFGIEIKKEILEKEIPSSEIQKKSSLLQSTRIILGRQDNNYIALSSRDINIKEVYIFLEIVHQNTFFIFSTNDYVLLRIEICDFLIFFKYKKSGKSQVCDLFKLRKKFLTNIRGCSNIYTSPTFDVKGRITVVYERI